MDIQKILSKTNHYINSIWSGKSSTTMMRDLIFAEEVLLGNIEDEKGMASVLVVTGLKDFQKEVALGIILRVKQEYLIRKTVQQNQGVELSIMSIMEWTEKLLNMKEKSHRLDIKTGELLSQIHPTDKWWIIEVTMESWMITRTKEIFQDQFYTGSVRIKKS